MKRDRHPLLMAAMIRIVSWLLRGLAATLRPVYMQEHIKRLILEGDEPVVLAIWHGRMLFFLTQGRGRRFLVLVSQSKDGELMSRLLNGLGVETARGSSSQGKVQGLLEVIRQMRRGYHAVITPDGPRGPCYHVQPGIVAAAQQTGAVIIPVTYNARWKRVLRSWDKFLIPLPFSRVVVVFGEPISAPAELSALTLEAKRQEVEACLRQITDVADRYYQ